MALSPMMQQYFAVKEQHPDEILFFRVGDFYEMFFEDAKKVSRELELALTGKDCGLEERAPMCGVPHHAAEIYIKRLIDKGYRVAICEQMENPAEAKGLVKRKIIRIVSPGTVIESSMLDEERNNFLCSVYITEQGVGICFCDISTGEIFANCLTDNLQRALINEMSRFSPREVIANPPFLDYKDVAFFLKEKLQVTFSPVDSLENTEHLREELVSAFRQSGVLTETIERAEEPILCAIQNLILYLDKVQMNGNCRITSVGLYSEKQYMDLDITARRNLELTETMRTKEKRGTLLWVLDKTKTAMGKRMMRNFVEQPLLNPVQIEQRLNAVEELFDNSVLCDEIRVLMADIPDMERLITRVVYGTANPRELKAMQIACERLPDLKEKLSHVQSRTLCRMYAQLDPLTDVTAKIRDAIADDAPAVLKDGGVIKKGFDPQIDELRDLVDNTRGYIGRIEAKEKEATGIKTLKIGYNRVFGYYLEVSKSFTDQVPAHYIRKQTLTGGERYITEELKELENKIFSASTRLAQLELELYTQVRQYVADQLFRIQQTAACIAGLDVYASLALVARRNHYVRPTITLDSEIHIKDGRHPVVEAILKDVPFVANDTDMNSTTNRVAIITGPNMAGKSTYMRQVALIVLMAQLGSFVPASAAEIGIVDSIFTRVGASDDLASGQSTFMVEMNEVAIILQNATSKSLIILDEVGRGTSTFDGMSIARAVLEYIADPKKIGVKTLFATHYHELTAMENDLNCVKNYNIAVKKRGDDITFLRRILKGAADDSYGIAVAKLAGVPDPVVNRAKEILKTLESGNEVDAPRALRKKESGEESDYGQTTLNPTPSQLLQELDSIDPQILTPIEALNVLDRLKKIAQAL